MPRLQLLLVGSLIALAIGTSNRTINAQPTTPAPLRWDALPAGQEPQFHLFAAEHSAGMLHRPGKLTPDNWFHDGHLRTYALVNMSDVVRTAEIQRGNGPVYMFGNARVPQLLETVKLTFNEADFPQKGKELTARELTSWINCQGILIVRHGKIVFEEYPGMDPSQRHLWMSTSKITMNMLLGKLVSEGKLDLSKKVEDYLPELKGKGYGSFTLQEVSDMDADLSIDEKDYHDPKSDFWHFGRSMGWFNEDGRWPGGNKQFLATVGRVEKPAGEVGENARYTSVNSQVLTWVVEKVTGVSYVEYFEQQIWRRIGAVSNASVSIDKTGFPFIGGGCSSTLRDLVRFGTIWAERGVAPDGTRVFAETWLTENTSGKGPKLRDYRYRNHSYSKNGCITHQGHSGQTLWVNPASGTIVGTFGSMTTPGGGNNWSRQAYLLLAEKIDQHLQEAKIAEQR